MIRLTCPHCGERDFTEFSFRAEATVTRPGQDETSAEVWMDYLYNRENPRGAYWEYWQHSAACRVWFKVLRDTLTHEILNTAAATSDVRHGHLAGGSPVPEKQS